jgi:hypothetical protein
LKVTVSKNTIHEALRYSRGDEVRVYSLHMVAGCVELWRVSTTAGCAPISVQETAFTDPDAAARFLDEIERALIAGGWRRQEPAC